MSNDSVAAVERPHVGWWIAIISGLTVLGALALDGGVYELWSTHVTTLLSRPLLLGVFIVALLLHVGEASYANRIAARLGLDVTGWTIQTLILGFPSLRLLLARLAK